jgi:hypothetical protein
MYGDGRPSIKLIALLAETVAVGEGKGDWMLSRSEALVLDDGRGECCGNSEEEGDGGRGGDKTGFDVKPLFRRLIEDTEDTNVFGRFFFEGINSVIYFYFIARGEEAVRRGGEGMWGEEAVRRGGEGMWG